jgi:MYXO-CTERM domain-containing protein
MALSLCFATPAWSAGIQASPLASPHATQMADAPEHVVQAYPRRMPLPPVTPGPDVVVYGYQAYWANDLNAVPWDHLSHIALFSAGVTTGGSFTHLDRWDLAEAAVSMAEPYGVKVHLCITNFSPSELSALLGSGAARSALIDNLADEVASTGVHGVNVDFEGLPSSQRENMVTFTRDLAARVGEVVLATPSVDWSDAWDYAALSQHADLFIMGYGYHWSGSDYAGPVDPLYGGDPWAQWSLSWTVDDYLDAGADPERVILGLPLYGYRWSVSSDNVPASTTASGSAIVWASAQEEAAIHGRQFDEASRTPYWYDGTRQGWYGDTDTLRERVQYAIESGIGGIGFWALHYDEGDVSLWTMIDEETAWSEVEQPDDEVDPNYTANAGRPFLAYVGDTVVLSGAASTGPDPLVYQWTQVAGPEVELDAPSSMEPSFRVRDVGNLVFELVVGDGEAWSAPVRSYVVVLDPAAGRRFRNCATGPAAPAWLALLALAALIRRRRTNTPR